MTKFDSYLAQIAETNSISPNISQTKPGTTPLPNQSTNNSQQANNNQQTNNNQTQTTPATTPPASQTPTTQQKLDLEKFIKDFNDNKITIQTPKDLEKYGLTVTK
jgi:hypothetical protein